MTALRENLIPNAQWFDGFTIVEDGIANKGLALAEAKKHLNEDTVARIAQYSPAVGAKVVSRVALDGEF